MQINIYVTGPFGVNCYVGENTETKKGFIVDPGGENHALIDFLTGNGMDLEYIILTHGHGDHIGGVEHYMDMFPNAKLVASKYEKEMLNDENLNESLAMYGFPLRIDADLYVDDGDTLMCGGYELKFIHTPGHTPGGMCILTEDILFSGDTLFRQSIGRTDLPGGDFSTLMKSIKEKLFVLPDETKVLPGHMGTTTIGYEKEHNPFVQG